jgi:hypothetical protein
VPGGTSVDGGLSSTKPFCKSVSPIETFPSNVHDFTPIKTAIGKRMNNAMAMVFRDIADN